MLFLEVEKSIDFLYYEIFFSYKNEFYAQENRKAYRIILKKANR